MRVPVERLKLGVVRDGVVAKNKPIGGFGVHERTVEHIERVVFDYDARMEKLLLVFQVGDFGIDGNHRVRELIRCRERIDEFVVSDYYIFTRSGFEPAVAVTAQ